MANEQVSSALWRVLQGNRRTSEPMNALVAWTELGRSFCETLDRKGADIGMIGRIIDGWCKDQGATAADLSRWGYQVEPSLRLSAEELRSLTEHLQRVVEQAVAPVAAREGEDGERAAFMEAVRGWFPVGLSILRSFPQAASAEDRELYGVLQAWVRRFFPRDGRGPETLGVRIEPVDPPEPPS